jgi:hypothetical protein
VARSLKKAKNRLEKGSFIAVQKCWLDHPNYSALSHRAVRMLWDLYIQYNGHNNGDFTAAHSIMKNKGWNSNDQISKAINELTEKGWIVRTRQGGRNIGCNLYAVTFQPIDECKGKKLFVSATIAPPGDWRKLKSLTPDTVLTAPYCGAGVV